MSIGTAATPDEDEEEALGDRDTTENNEKKKKTTNASTSISGVHVLKQIVVAFQGAAHYGEDNENEPSGYVYDSDLALVYG